MLHAIALLAHFHALTSFTFGCGVTAELDQETAGYTYDAECFHVEAGFDKHSPSNGLATVEMLQVIKGFLCSSFEHFQIKPPEPNLLIRYKALLFLTSSIISTPVLIHER